LPIKAAVAAFSDLGRDTINTAANCLVSYPSIIYVGDAGDMYDLSIIRERSGYVLCVYHFGAGPLR
jgi:hypothetical protein